MRLAKHLFTVFTIVLILKSGVQQLSGETVNCTAITSLPFTITSSGVYCLKNDLTIAVSSGDAITVDASSVSIDFNNWSLSCSNGEASGVVRGVKSVASRKNIKVMNGKINGCDIGIEFQTDKSIVEDMRITGVKWIGITIEGGAGSNIVRHNFIADIQAGKGYNAYGINVRASNAVRIIDNDIANLDAVYPTVAIQIQDSARHCLVINNRMTGADQGISYSNNSAGKYRDNLTSNITTPYTGGTDAGNNN